LPIATRLVTEKSTPVWACWPLSHLRKIPASITHGRAGIQDIAIKLEEQGDGSRQQAQGAELDRMQIYARHDRPCKIGSAAIDNDILRQKLEILAKQAELREQQFAAEFKAKSLEVQLYEAKLQQQTELATTFGAKLEQAAEREIAMATTEDELRQQVRMPQPTAPASGARGHRQPCTHLKWYHGLNSRESF
jgi:hypothetical protein